MNKKFIKNALFFLTVAAIAISCSKKTVSDEINIIDLSTTSISEKQEGQLNESKIAALKVQADEEFNYLKKFHTNLKSTYIPIWVGVIPNSGECPAGVPQIIYNEDLEDNNPATKYEQGCTGCFKSNGLSISGGNVTWRVCIVDAVAYKFGAINKGYSIIDLSLGWYTDQISVWIDDEDSNNQNSFSNRLYGFTLNPNYPYYPTQTLNGNTNFWLYYFKAENNTLKLPNLGFSYSVFSNFSSSDWTNQNTILLDSEDSNPSNTIVYYHQDPYQPSVNMGGNKVDPTYGIVQGGANVRLFLQNADVYRN